MQRIKKFLLLYFYLKTFKNYNYFKIIKNDVLAYLNSFFYFKKMFTTTFTQNIINNNKYINKGNKEK